MRRSILALVVVFIANACVMASSAAPHTEPPPSVAPSTCPEDRLTGVLHSYDGRLLLFGEELAEVIHWPAGFDVRRDGDALVVVEVGIGVVAREGDEVILYGSDSTSFSSTWEVCRFEVLGPAAE